MEGLSLANAITSSYFSVSGTRHASFPFTPRRRTRRFVTFSRKTKFAIFASNEEPKLDKWDQMELKFGRMLGEDPKLTLAKIMGRKANPDASYLEIEKSFYNKDKGYSEIKEVPFDLSKSSDSSSSSGGLNLIRPVPKKGTKFESSDKPIPPGMEKNSTSVGKSGEKTEERVPNVILRKPSMFIEDNAESSKFSIKPNLTLKMRNQRLNERFTDMTVLRRPEPTRIRENKEKEQGSFNDSPGITADDAELRLRGEEAKNDDDAFTLLEKPEKLSPRAMQDSDQNQSRDTEAQVANHAKENLVEGAQHHRQYLAEATEESTVNELSGTNVVDSKVQFYKEAALQGKPERLGESVKERSDTSRAEMSHQVPEKYGSAVEFDSHLASSPLEEQEEMDWTRAEHLVKIEEKGKVELISSSTRGFAASFGSLMGFLPYRNLATKWKFIAFESWLRRKGVDPSKYRQNLGIIGSHDVTNKSPALNSSPEQVDPNIQGEITADMKLEDLLKIYNQEKLKYLSSFVGQKINVHVILADRRARKLIFSARPKEREESIEKKKNLMAKLCIGDVVKCCIKKITYFGIFVEVEGVPALIHQTEVSWDATLDPTLYFKIGQIVEAKVHQLDFGLERIFLSLKEITPDPLIEALESVVGGNDMLEGRLEAVEADTEWADVESLIKELQQIEGIRSVSKGRFFQSPGLAPTFQVYMASMFENEYKLLARSGNKVQEVIVETSLGKEEMKSAILTCTNRVA